MPAARGIAARSLHSYSPASTKNKRTAMQRKRFSSGVTLIEACVVLAISAITLSAAVPNFRTFIETRRLSGVASQLATDIQFVRSEAVRRNQTLRLSVYAQAWGSCYVLHSGPTKQCSCTPDGPAQCAEGAIELKTVVLPARDAVQVQANVGYIAFDPLHGTSSPTGTLQVVGPSGRAIRHVVNIMGRVRTCTSTADAPAVAGYTVCAT
jgi:type IV fimbrial biogenesis protein FimT